LDKQAITEGIYRYCRAVDRMDKDMFRRVFRADLVANYFPGETTTSVEQLIDYMWGQHNRFHSHSHQVSNILIEVNGAAAGSEAYVHARLVRRLENGRFELITVMGRYADRWDKRDGEWKIAERRYMQDFMDIREIDDYVPANTTFAVRDPNDVAKDPSYEVIDTHARQNAAE
jgi:hypothetical protein